MKKLLLLSDDRPLSHKKIEVCIKYIFFQIVSLHLLQHCFIIKLEFVSYKATYYILLKNFILSNCVDFYKRIVAVHFCFIHFSLFRTVRLCIEYSFLCKVVMILEAYIGIIPRIVNVVLSIVRVVDVSNNQYD